MLLIQDPLQTLEVQPQSLSAWLEAFRLAVTGPLAAFVFILAAGAVVYLTVRKLRLRSLWTSVAKLPADDRIRVTTAEMGAIYLRQGMTAAQWLRAKAQHYGFQRFLILILALLFVVVIAIDNFTTRRKLLRELLDDSAHRAEAIEWLRTQYGLFHVDEPRLVDSLAAVLRLTEAIIQDSTPSTRYRILSRVIDDRALLRELRRRADAREAPFEPLGTGVSVGLPREPDHRPRVCEANVEMDSPFAHNPIEIINPRNRRSLILMPRARIAPLGYSQPLIQLNSAQTSYLFPSGIATTEQAILVPHLSADSLRDPSSTANCRSVLNARDVQLTSG